MSIRRGGFGVLSVLKGNQSKHHRHLFKQYSRQSPSPKVAMNSFHKYLYKHIIIMEMSTSAFRVVAIIHSNPMANLLCYSGCLLRSNLVCYFPFFAISNH